MIRVAFFGMHGAFSTVPLKALTQSGIEVALVVLGTEARPGARRFTQVVPARPSFWNRHRNRLLRGKTPRPKEDLTQAAHALGVDVVQTSWANDPSVVARLRRLGVDAYVVCGFPHLLGSALLDVPRFGGMNLHPGALPEERGPAPLFWALKEGRTNIRWTLHVLDEHEDSGDVISQGQLAFEPGTEGQDILRRVAQAAVPFLVRAVRAMHDGDLVQTPQSSTPVRRRRRPRFRDGLVDPQRSAEEVFTFVSACAQSYSLFVESAEDRFFIGGALSYDPLAETPYEWVLTGDRLILRCRPGVVELQLKTDGALFAAEYADSAHRLPQGV